MKQSDSSKVFSHSFRFFLAYEKELFDISLHADVYMKKLKSLLDAVPVRLVPFFSLSDAHC